MTEPLPVPGQEQLVAARDRALEVGDLARAKPPADALVQHYPAAEHWRTAGLIALNLGDVPAAIASLRSAVRLDPTADGLRADLAAVLELSGELGEAQNQLHEAIRLQPGELRHRLKLAAVLLALGKHAESAMLARQVVAKAPNLQAGWHVLADGAFAQGDWPAALRSFQRALELNAPDNTGQAAKLWYNVGLCAGKLNAPERALIAFDRALALDAKLYAALAQRVFHQRKAADWQGLTENAARLLALVRLGVPGITPFSFLAEHASAADQLSCARAQSKQTAREAGVAFDAPRSARPAQQSHTLRAGFVSNGFGQHPTGLLTVEFFESLDRKRLQTVLFATAASDGGPIRRRLASAVELICDISALDPKGAANKVRELRIDVLFDLRGFGDGGTPALFAHRPAPVQVNWLAYPGTSGAPWMDYVFADAQVLPAALRSGFSECVLRLPGTFQPYDGQTAIAPALPRASFGLPESGFVFACLNNSYKINPELFAAWVHILRRCPGSVLWLLQAADGEAFASNMRAHFAGAQLDTSRLIFLQKRPHDQYLAALTHADVFLDSFPYGAHTSARDALFVGCPVLTIAGASFAARVATSLNAAADLTECNARDLESYIETAVQMAHAPTLVAAARMKLRAAHARLFDSAAFAQNFMRAVELIDARARSGLAPMDLDVS